jgi:hypothetical protein
LNVERVSYMKRVQFPSGANDSSKKRRTRAHAVSGSLSQGPSGTRHVRLAETGRRRLSQRRKDQQITNVPPSPVYAIDDSVDPDDAINEWVDEPQDIPSGEPIVSTAKPKRRTRETMSVC